MNCKLFIIFSVITTLFCVTLSSSCSKDTKSTTATCTDGIQNQDETGIDCGGANCSACSTSQDLPLIATITLNGSASNWKPPLGNSSATVSNANTLLIVGNINSTQISLKYTGSFQQGNGLNAIANYSNGNDICSNQAATINFSSFNTTTKKISGTFAFQGTTTTGKTLQVSGIITNMSYN